MTIINALSFEVTGTESPSWMKGETREVGTVECTLGRETRRVDAVRYNCGKIVTWAMVGRYLTGKVDHPATVSLDAGSDRDWVWYGKSHSARNCTKTGLRFK